MVETTDVVFAVDSVPAIFGVSRETFIVFSSNAFAILGLRALYFLPQRHAGPLPVPQLRPRRRSSAFVGTKMILTFTGEQFDFPTGGLPLPDVAVAR